MTRKEAIERLKYMRSCLDMTSTNEQEHKSFIAVDMAIKALEPKVGHWIDGHCSECGCDVPAYIIDWKWQKDMDAKYCPNCGYRMESEG